jgi:hypothetical protein
MLNTQPKQGHLCRGIRTTPQKTPPAWPQLLVNKQEPLSQTCFACCVIAEAHRRVRTLVQNEPPTFTHLDIVLQDQVEGWEQRTLVLLYLLRLACCAVLDEGCHALKEVVVEPWRLGVLADLHKHVS